MHKFLVILTILSSYAISVNGQWEKQWEKMDGPDGATIRTLVSDGITLFTSTTTGVFKLDGSGSWVSISQNLPDQNITAIATINILHELYVATLGGIYRTNNNGSTWSLVFNNIGVCNALFVSEVMGIVEIYAANSSNVYKSINYGSTWTSLGSPVANGISSIRVLNDYVFAATTVGTGLYRFVGATWLAVNLDPTGGSQGFTSIGNTLYIVKGSTLYKSTNNGINWSIVDMVDEGYLAAIGNSLFFSSSSGLKKSENGSYSWTSVGSVTGLAFNSIVQHGTNLYAGSTGGAIYKSNDLNGTSWTMLSKGLIPKVRAMRFIGNKLWVGTYAGLFVSDDNGTSWSRVTGVTSIGISCIYSDDDNTIYVGTLDQGVFISYNAGESWTHFNFNIGPINCITKHNGELYISSYDMGTYKGWSKVSTKSFSSMASKNGMLYGANYGVYYSPDGVTWTLSSLTPGNEQAAVHNINDTLFVSTNNRIQYSPDGLNWTRSSLGDNIALAYYIIGNNNILYAASDMGVFRSVDHATSWHGVNLPTQTVLAVQGNTLYGGKYGMVKKDLRPEVSLPTDLTLFTALPTKPSETQRFVIEYNLLPSNISVSVGSGFEFQINPVLDYIFPFMTSGAIRLSSTRYFVLNLRLNRNELGPIADSIAIRCKGMPTIYIPINGEVVEKFSQTIDFPEIENVNTTDHSFELAATASSGLPTTFETTDTDIISISGNTASILGTGEVTVTAHQVGNEIFLPAEDVSRTFTVDLVLDADQPYRSNIHVYPNPTSGKIRLIDNAEVIGLTNIMGQPQTFECISGTLDLQGLPSGVYFLKIKKESQIYTTRILKN